MGGDTLKEEKIAELKISIHAPRVGGDVRAHHLRMVDIISIHAPRVGGDIMYKEIFAQRLNFNPRPPCGGRPHDYKLSALRDTNFNPRPPCGGRPHMWWNK